MLIIKKGKDLYARTCCKKMDSLMNAMILAEDGVYLSVFTKTSDDKILTAYFQIWYCPCCGERIIIMEK